MREPPSDTSPEVEAFVIAGYRAMSGVERLRRMSELTIAVRRLAAADVRRLYPSATEREARAHLARRFLPAELAVRVAG